MDAGRTSPGGEPALVQCWRSGRDRRSNASKVGWLGRVMRAAACSKPHPEQCLLVSVRPDERVWRGPRHELADLLAGLVGRCARRRHGDTGRRGEVDRQEPGTPSRLQVSSRRRAIPSRGPTGTRAAFRAASCGGAPRAAPPTARARESSGHAATPGDAAARPGAAMSGPAGAAGRAGATRQAVAARQAGAAGGGGSPTPAAASAKAAAETTATGPAAAGATPGAVAGPAAVCRAAQDSVDSSRPAVRTAAASTSARTARGARATWRQPRRVLLLPADRGRGGIDGVRRSALQPRDGRRLVAAIEGAGRLPALITPAGKRGR